MEEDMETLYFFGLGNLTAKANITQEIGRHNGIGQFPVDYFIFQLASVAFP